MIGIGAGNGRTEVLSVNNGSANLSNAAAELWTPSPGETDFDIGAFEFQGNSADKTPPTVTSISTIPAAGGTTALGFTSFAITFSKPLDTISATSPANYTLIAAGPDGVFDTKDDITIPVVPTLDSTGTIVTLTLPDGPLPDGDYRLTLSGTKAILDVSANKLAGSGGVAGTNYVTTFVINRAGDVPPIATAQSDTVAEYGSVTLTLAATDSAGNPLTYSIVTPPSFGTLSAINPVTDQVIYTPTTGTYGNDSFVFQAVDNELGISDATVSLTVTPVNLPPVAMAQAITVSPGQARTIVLTATDKETPGSQLTYTVGTEPAHGTLTQSSANTFVYTPTGTYVGADSFTFTATDTGNPPGTVGNKLTSAPATVSLDVVASPPHAQNDSYTIQAGFTLRVAAATGVLANDTDAESNTLTAALEYGQPSHGTVTLASDGSFVYTPNAGFTGTDTFYYAPSDQYAQGNVAAVTITVVAGPTPVIPPAKGKIPTAPPVVIPPAKGAIASPPAPVVTQAASVPAVASSNAPAMSVAAFEAPVTPTPVAPSVLSTGAVVVPVVPVVRVAAPSVLVTSSIAAAPVTAAVSGPAIVTAAAPVLPPADLAALMLPPVPAVQRLPAALKALIDTVTAPRLDAIFFDPNTGALQDSATSGDAGDDWLVFDPVTAPKHHKISWEAHT